ncbi:IS200/IS605 family accessory protein TnpB-related protein [Streptomyces sp. NPDC048337]|uniref:IS200/IS605 family accessory protein TnpB-related protein n=1 Tax=Streptomyces sp. NPDC048337 TaxID=3365535 RepID=UPI00371C44BA
MGGLRELSAPFVALGPAGVTVRARLKDLTPQDEAVLRRTGAHLGVLASRDLRARCADGLDHSTATWAARKRELTPAASSRWAGAVTKATHDQWGLARRGQAAHIRDLEAGIRTIRHRLSLPLGEKGSKGAPGGYRSKREWFAKTRRLNVLEDRLGRAREDHDSGRVRVVRGGKHLLGTRNHLDAARLTETEWRDRWEASRWFLQADGESGKRFGNETIRVTPDGEVSIKLPTPLAGLANAKRGRYVLTSRIAFAHRGTEWADRVGADRAVAYRVHYDTERHRWYLSASWHYPPTRTVPLDAALAHGVIGVDMNADHLAAWRLDQHGNPIGAPRRFRFDLTGTAGHRDAQVRHALTRLLHWTSSCEVTAIAIEDLDFSAEKTCEKHGRRKRFRQLISVMPTGNLRARLTSMAGQASIAIIAVDPAYTSKWGAQHWQKPLTSKNRTTTRHDAASIAIGRRAQGHPIRRRTAPPYDDRSDRRRHRTAQAGLEALGCEESRHRIPGPRTRSAGTGRGVNAGDQNAQDRSGRSAEHGFWRQDSLPLGL